METSLAVHLSEKFASDREKIERYSALAEHCPLPAFIIASDARTIVYINPAYEEMTGRLIDELQDDWIATVVHSDDRDTVRLVWKLFTNTGRCTPHWHRYISKAGDVTDALTTLQRVQNNGYVGYVLPQCGSETCPIRRLNHKVLNTTWHAAEHHSVA